MSSLLLTARRRWVGGEFTPPTPPPDTNLLGVGSSSDSLSVYPKTSPTTSGNWYVNANGGSDSNSGTSLAQAFATIQKALSSVSNGQTILVKGGTYNISSTITRNTNWATGIRVMGYADEVPVINASGVGNGIAISLNGRREHWKGFRVRNASMYGVRVQNSFNKLENIYVHDSATATYGVGIIVIESAASDNIVQDCAVWRIGTPGAGGTNTPDGITFTASPGTDSARNVAVRCLVANATDDSFDFYRSRNSKFIDCVSVGSGYYYNGNTSSAEGHGYKMGSGSVSGNEVIGSIAVHGRRTGLNGNGASSISYINCTSYGNNYGVEFRGGGSSAYAENNLILSNSTNVVNNQYNTLPPGGSLVNNSWQVGVTTGNILFGSMGSGDFSLMPGSSGIGSGSGSENLGASTLALEVLKTWWNHSGIWVPGRGNGPGGTGLPGDTA